MERSYRCKNVFFLSLLLYINRIESNSHCFPSKFLWGTATAAYQVEGGWQQTKREMSIWDSFCRNKISMKCADVADDMLNRYSSDFKLMSDLGMSSYRFSISWSRVMNWNDSKQKMIPNREGIEFYHSMIDELNTRNIVPILTMYHWDLPHSLDSQLSPRGWLNSAIQDHFVDYANVLFREYGQKVTFWATFNEPLTFVVQGYDSGSHAPGFSKSTTFAYDAAHNVLLSHGKAVKLFRQLKAVGLVSKEAQIGMALNSDIGFPLDPNSEKDQQAVIRRLHFNTGWWLFPMVYGKYPDIMKAKVQSRLPQFSSEESEMMKGSYDLFMINHYTTKVVTDCDPFDKNTTCLKGVVGFRADRGVDDSRFPEGSKLSSTTDGKRNCAWFAGVPQGKGYYEIIEWFYQQDKSVNILLTENGWCGNNTIENYDQLWYYQNYLQPVLRAVQDGIPVIGYSAWSFMDNYEWGSYTPRFGLFHVEYPNNWDSKGTWDPQPTDLVRTPRPAAIWFGKVAETGCLVFGNDSYINLNKERVG